MRPIYDHASAELRLNVDRLPPPVHRHREIGAVWVPESGRTSCDLLILVHQSAEAVAPADVVDLGSRRVGEWS
jgi:hypothetical protein